MQLNHKAGSSYGIDYGVVAVLCLWILATIALVVALAVRGNPQNVTVLNSRASSQNSGACIYERSTPGAGCGQGARSTFDS